MNTLHTALSYILLLGLMAGLFAFVDHMEAEVHKEAATEPSWAGAVIDMQFVGTRAELASYCGDSNVCAWLKGKGDKVCHVRILKYRASVWVEIKDECSSLN